MLDSANVYAQQHQRKGLEENAFMCRFLLNTPETTLSSERGVDFLSGTSGTVPKRSETSTSDVLRLKRDIWNQTSILTSALSLFCAVYLTGTSR